MSSLNQAVSNSENVGMSQNWFMCADCKEMRPPQTENKNIQKEAGDPSRYCKHCCDDIEATWEGHREERLRELRRDMRYE